MPETIESYLRELDHELFGPREWKRRVIAETEDGMRDELEARDGLPESEIVRQWGCVEEIAREFNRSGRAIMARRMAWNILHWTPILAIGWALVVQLSPDPWPSEPRLIWWFSPLLFASTAAAVIGAVQLVRGSSRSLRSGGEVRGVVCSCVGVGVGVLCLAVMLCYRLVSSHWHVFWFGAITTGVLTLMLLATVAVQAWQLSQPVSRRVRTR